MSLLRKRFSICRQHDSMQCGVACLQMICNYYGQEWTLDELSRYYFDTSEGVSLLGISEVAEELGEGWTVSIRRVVSR